MTGKISTDTDKVLPWAAWRNQIILLAWIFLLSLILRNIGYSLSQFRPNKTQNNTIRRQLLKGSRPPLRLKISQSGHLWLPRIRSYQQKVIIIGLLFVFMRLLLQTNYLLTYIQNMQAYVDDDQKDKGLFTFYIEQAELEEKTKQQKKVRQRPPETFVNDKKQIRHPYRHPSKPQPQASIKQTIKPDVKHTDQQQKQHNHAAQPLLKQEKLVELLQKQKYKHNKMKNFRIILNESEFRSGEYHNRLQLLLNDESRVKKEGIDGIDQSSKLKKKSAYLLQKYDPFKKLYLSPKNFEHSFDEPVVTHNIKFAQPLKTKSHDQQLHQSRKIVHKQVDKSNLTKPEDKQTNPFNNLPQHLPKLQLRCVSQLSNQVSLHSKVQKLRLKSNRNRMLPEVPPQNIKSQRLKRIDGSLLIENMRYRTDKKKILESKAYPIFMESQEGKNYEQETRKTKDQIYMDILRQLKFK